MTRLQKGLSKIRTTKELSQLFGITEDCLVRSLAILPSNELMRCQEFECHRCALYGKECFFSAIGYLNAEIPDVDHKPTRSTPVIEMREKTLTSLKERMNNARKEKADPLLTAMILDLLCDLVEDIGLFLPHECHDELIRITKEKHS